MITSTKLEKWQVRKARVRKKVVGSPQRPRLCVYRSLKHIYVQVIDDSQGRTLLAASSFEKAQAGQFAGKKPKERASLVGAMVAERCKAQGITQVVFDRSGYKYHGCVLELAEAARKGGLNF